MWYHARNIPVANEGTGQCHSAFYTLDGDSLKLKYSVINNGIKEFVLGVANKADDAYNAAKLILNIHVGKSTTVVQPLWVLATDYSNYAVSYYCNYDEDSNTHKLSLWVLSRSKNLEGEAKESVDAFLSSKFDNFDASKFTMVEQSEEACKFHTSHVYTGSDEH